MDWAQAFASGSTTKIPLDDKHWIELRDELSHGESNAIAIGSFRRVYRENEVVVEFDPKVGSDLKVLAYLVDWNLTGSTGKTIDISSDAGKRDAVKNLSPEAYALIEKKVDAHAEAMAQKKTGSGKPLSLVTSVSQGS